MSDPNQMTTDLIKLSDDAKIFVGDFLYAPFGVESSEGVNAITLYALIAIAIYVLYRVSKREEPQRTKTRVYRRSRQVVRRP